MFRRLYFLLPDSELAQKLTHDLCNHGVLPTHIHAHCRDKSLRVDLPRATLQQRLDIPRKIEYVLWRTDLLIFFIALTVLFTAFVINHYGLAILSVVAMIISFFTGEQFASHIPNVHLDEFNDALAHNEVLLMIDVKREFVGQIEKMVSLHHPTAIAGGTTWTLNLHNI